MRINTVHTLPISNLYSLKMLKMHKIRLLPWPLPLSHDTDTGIATPPPHDNTKTKKDEDDLDLDHTSHIRNNLLIPGHTSQAPTMVTSSVRMYIRTCKSSHLAHGNPDTPSHSPKVHPTSVTLRSTSLFLSLSFVLSLPTAPKIGFSSTH